MALSEYIRVGDFSDDEAANKGGRSNVDTAQLDAELDAIKAVTDEATTLLSVVLRDDNKVQDDLLEGHEFSAAAINYLGSQVGSSFIFQWRGNHAAATDYTSGNFVFESNGSYVCLKDHNSDDYANFAAALADDAWALAAAPGSAGIGSGSANEVLYETGAGIAWGSVTTAMAPTLAPKASPALTGTTTTQNITLGAAAGGHTVTINGRVIFDVYDYGTKATPSTTALDLSQAMMQKIAFSNASTWIPGATVGKVEGAAADIRITGSSTGDVTVTWPVGWVWMGFKPSTIVQNSTGYLSLRCYGTNESDIVASWVET